MSAPETSRPEFFEHMYERSADPWHFAESPAEQHRYDRVLSALAGRRYRHGVEPGCSVGVLTARLATICDRLEAYDFAASAVLQAQARVARLEHVSVRCASFPDVATDLSQVDLLVLSEIGYYFRLEDWQRIAAEQIAQLPQGATVLAVHWTGESADHQISGVAVQEKLHGLQGLRHACGERGESFLLDRWERI